MQVQGLVRSATVGAVTNVATTALAGGNVGAAVHSGADGIAKSLFGDSSVPLVDPVTHKKSTAGNAVAPVKRLGAIGTVSTAVQKAACDVGDAVGVGS